MKFLAKQRNVKNQPKNNRHEIYLNKYISLTFELYVAWLIDNNTKNSKIKDGNLYDLHIYCILFYRGVSGSGYGMEGIVIHSFHLRFHIYFSFLFYFRLNYWMCHALCRYTTPFKFLWRYVFILFLCQKRPPFLAPPNFFFHGMQKNIR